MASPNETISNLKSNFPEEAPSIEIPTLLGLSNTKNIDIDIGSVISDEDFHLTPASLPPTTYQLLTKGNAKNLKAAIRLNFLKHGSVENSPLVSRLPSQTRIQEKSEEHDEESEGLEKESNVDISANMGSNLGSNFNEAQGLKIGFQKTGIDGKIQIETLASLRKTTEVFLNPRRRARALTNESTDSPSLGRSKRRLAVCMFKAFSPEQVYFLDYNLGYNGNRRESKSVEQHKNKPEPRKFVNAVASAATKSNSPAAKILHNALKKINPKVLEESKKKKTQKPILKRILEGLNILSKSLIEYVPEPDSSFIIFWLFLTVIMILLDLIYLPFFLSFYYPEHTTGFFLEYPLFAFFLSNILLKFNMAYYSKGTLVKERRKIARYYLKRTFFLDFLTLAITIPRVLFGNDYLVYFESIRILRMITLRKCMSKLEDHMRLSVIWSGVVKLIKLWVSILIIAHFLACIFHKIGAEDKENTSWLDVFGFRYESIYKKYVASAYWAVMTMITIGYGDITPQNEIERIFTILTMLSTSIIFGYTMNTISIILDEIDEHQTQKKKKIRGANNYMKMKGLDKDIQIRVRKYLEHNLDEQNFKRSMENDFIGMLHGKLKHEVLVEINGKILRDCHIFKENGFTKRFLADVSQSLIEIFLSPEQDIFYEGETADQSMYFLTRGKVQIYLRECDKILKTLGKNSHFGEISFFTGKPRSASARSLNFSEVFRLNKDRFLQIIKYSSLDKEQFHFLKDMLNFESRYDLLKIRCYACDEIGHIIFECPQLQLILNKKGVIQQYVRDQERFKKTFQRSKNKLRYTMEELAYAADKIWSDLDQGQLTTSGSPYRKGSYSLSHLYSEDRYLTKTYFQQKRHLASPEELGLVTPEPDTLYLLQNGTLPQLKPPMSIKNSFFDPYFMTLNFDRVANYELFFPYNNIQKLVIGFEEKRIEAIIGMQSGKLERTDTRSKMIKKGLNALGGLKNLPMVNSKATKKSKHTGDATPDRIASFINFESALPNYAENQNGSLIMPQNSRYISIPYLNDNISVEAVQRFVQKSGTPDFNDPGSGSPIWKGQTNYGFEESNSPGLHIDLYGTPPNLAASTRSRKSSPKLIITPVRRGQDQSDRSIKDLSMINRLSFQSNMYKEPITPSISTFLDVNQEEQQSRLTQEFGLRQDRISSYRNDRSQILGMIESSRMDANILGKRGSETTQSMHSKTLEVIGWRRSKLESGRDMTLPSIRERKQSDIPAEDKELKDKKLLGDTNHFEEDMKSHITSLLNTFGAKRVIQTIAELEENGSHSNPGVN